MSWQAMTAVSRHSKQDGLLFRLILHLAEFADHTGLVDPAPNQETLAEHFACTGRTIRNRLNTICAAGELIQTRVGSGPGQPSAYRILLPMPEAKAENADNAGKSPNHAPSGKAEKAEENAGFISAFEAQMAEIKAEILSLKAEILELKAETKGGKGGKGGNERRKAHSTKIADDPYLIHSDPIKREERAGATPPPAAAPDLLLAEMVNALAEVTLLDGHLNWQPLSQLANELTPAYSPQQIRMYYGPEQSPNGHWNWYLHDWRGQKNDPPRPKEIRETVKKAVAGIIPKPKPAKSAKKPPPPDTGLKQIAPGVY